MLTTDRAVMVRYKRDGKPRRGSGLRVAGRFVLTADHCAAGTDHTIVAGGAENPATVLVRSGSSEVDLALLQCPSLPAVEPLRCAAVGWDVPRWVQGCRALGFPVWKDSASGPRLAQVPGTVPTAEGVDPRAERGVVPPMSLKITNPEIRDRRVLEGDLDRAGSPWAGMSGAVVVTADDLVVGVVRGHSPAEGTGSLTVTRLEAITSLPEDVARRFLTALQMTDPREWPRVPLPPGDRSGLALARGQVVVGEIPREPPAFVARETLAGLAAAAGRGPAVVCAVTGLRGVGKTQIAAAYARARVSEGWGLVGWVNAETRDTLLTGLARVADQLGAGDPEGDSLESARLLREHLLTRASLGLLVFDNATDPDGLRPFLPATGSTQVVVTTTDRAFTEFGETVDVAAFSRPESLRYLQARTGLADQAGAAAVARELGDLPLGLAQAAASISRQHLTYPKYLERLRRVPVQALLGGVSGGDYPRSTAAALLMSIEATEASDPTGLTGRLLRILAVLSPDGVRRDILGGLAAGGSSGEDEVDAALERCGGGSLLTWSVTGDAVIMHRLLARVLRERDQTGGQWAGTVTAALDLLEPRFIPKEQAWARREEGADLVTQVEALAKACAETGAGGEDLCVRELRARSWAARQLQAAADLSRAVDLGARTLADSERMLGADHPQTPISRNNLAIAYQSAGRLELAIPLFEQAVAGFEQVLGADYDVTINSRRNLAYAYQSAGRLELAIAMYERALADCERVLGDDDPDTVACRDNLPAPTGRRASWSWRSRCSSRPWRIVSGCWAPTTLRPSPPGTTSPPPTSRQADWSWRLRCTNRPWLTGSGC